MVDFDLTLRIARQRAGVTQQALAKAAGVTQAYVSNIEGGRARPTSTPTITAFAETLGIDPDILFAAAGQLPSDVAYYAAHHVAAIKAVRAMMADEDQKPQLAVPAQDPRNVRDGVDIFRCSCIDHAAHLRVHASDCDGYAQSASNKGTIVGTDYELEARRCRHAADLIDTGMDQIDASLQARKDLGKLHRER